MQNKYIDPQNQKLLLRLRLEFEFWVFIYSENIFFIAFSKSLFWGLNGCKSVPDIGKSQVQGCLRLNTNYVPFAYLILN